MSPVYSHVRETLYGIVKGSFADPNVVIDRFETGWETADMPC